MREQIGKPVKSEESKKELYEKLKIAADGTVEKAIPLIKLAIEKGWTTFKKINIK